MSDKPTTRKEWPLWEVFVRGQHGLNHRHVGSLHAPDAEMAINNARDVYTRRKEGVSHLGGGKPPNITASSPSDKGPLFDPADDKVYRHPTFYDIPERSGAHVMSSPSRHERGQRAGTGGAAGREQGGRDPHVCTMSR